MIPIGRGQRELIIRGPPDGQDRRRARHNHQPEGRRRDCDLRRHRAEALDGGPSRQDARKLRCHGLHDRRRCLGERSGPHAVSRAVFRLRDGRVFPRRQAARPVHLRRPLEARCRVPGNFAPPPAAARTGGVSGRRILSPLAPPGARRQTQRREGRGLFDGTADHRNAGGRRFCLHSHQRHLDYRRADLSRDRPVQ